MEIASAHHSTSRTDGDGDPVTLADLLGECDERFERVEASVTIGPAIGQLSDRDRKILALRFEHDLSQSQIAGLIGVSQMQVSIILRRVINHLRAIAESHQPLCDSRQGLSRA